MSAAFWEALPFCSFCPASRRRRRAKRPGTPSGRRSSANARSRTVRRSSSSSRRSAPRMRPWFRSTCLSACAPLAATFTFGEDRRSFGLSTRMRVNSYSFVRAIAETSDGKLHMVKAYVKAAGGCSAPAGKDMAEAKANLGQMRFRVFSGSGEAQVQIRHPTYSGLQMDQVTRLYTPAWFIETITVAQGAKPIFRMEGGISISEDPTFRFSYEPNGEPVTVEAADTEKQIFRQVFPGGPPA